MGKKFNANKTNYLKGQRPGAADHSKGKQNTSMSAFVGSRELSILKNVFFFFHCFDVLPCFPRHELVQRDRMDVLLFDIEARLPCSLTPTHNKQEGNRARGGWCACVHCWTRPEDSCSIHQDFAVSWASKVSRENMDKWPHCTANKQKLKADNIIPKRKTQIPII